MTLETFHASCRQQDARRDPELRHYFYPTQALKDIQALASDATIVVGLKGVGKSAAFRYLTEFSPDAALVSGISLATHSFFLPNKDLSSGVCAKQFRKDLLFEALRLIITHQDLLKGRVPLTLCKEAKATLKSYTDLVKQHGGRFGGVSILGCGFTLNAVESSVAVGLQPTEEKATKAERILDALPHHDVQLRIVIDDPEEVFSATKSLDVELIGGLCLAALQLQKDFSNLQIILLMKSHVFLPVYSRIDDLHNFPEDMIQHLWWSDEELFSVIDRRREWASVRWDELFADGEQGARQTIGELCSRIRTGPRDLLKWFDMALRSKGSETLSRDDFFSLEREMAEECFEQLQSTNFEELPGLGQVLRTVFRDVKKEVSVEQLSAILQKLYTRDHDMKEHQKLGWMQRQNYKSLPQLFFRTGTLAFRVGDRLVLPYDREYRFRNFLTTSAIRLVPALEAALR